MTLGEKIEKLAKEYLGRGTFVCIMAPETAKGTWLVSPGVCGPAVEGKTLEEAVDAALSACGVECRF